MVRRLWGARVRGWVKNTAGRCGFRVKTRAESAVGWDAHLGLGGGDPVHDEAALRVVDEAEVLVGLVDGNDVCGREGVGFTVSHRVRLFFSPRTMRWKGGSRYSPMKPAG